MRRALAALFGGTVGKDTVSRTWRKVKSDWDAWHTRSLTGEPIVRLILDGTVVRVRLDRKATSISLLVVLGVREDGQKVLLAIKSMGGESAEAWRTVLADLINRGLRRPEFLIVDGAPGLDKAIAAVWDGVPVQRCTVHKHRNLFAHARDSVSVKRFAKSLARLRRLQGLGGLLLQLILKSTSKKIAGLSYLRPSRSFACYLSSLSASRMYFIDNWRKRCISPSAVRMRFEPKDIVPARARSLREPFI